MPRLRLLIGPAGSGKTDRVLKEAATLALAGALPSPGHPPLLVIVPEQQAVQIERLLLGRLAELEGGDSRTSATARIRVMSLSRLAAWLARRAGQYLPRMSDTASRLLVWRLLDEGPERDARAEALASLVAELTLYGTNADELMQSAQELRGTAEDAPAERKPGQAARLAGKLDELAGLLSDYQAECSKLGLAFHSPPAWIPELLTEENWPLLKQTMVWVDGFSGFTPAEEKALSALLEGCGEVTATILLDPVREHGPALYDHADWYAPTRELFARWQELAQAAGAEVEVERLPGLHRWPPGSPLAQLSANGPQAAHAAEQKVSTAGGSALDDPLGIKETADPTSACRAVACAGERAEADAAARWALEMAREHGLRYGEISVVCRSLAPYSGLLAASFSDYNIPYFLDQRRLLHHHPAVELLRCGLRLALGLATEDEVYVLLKTDLLPTAGGRSLGREKADQLENYAREHGLAPFHWLANEAWKRHRSLLRREERERLSTEEREEIQRALTELDAWRKEMLAPVMELKAEVDSLPAERLTVEAVLGAAWRHLIPQRAGEELEEWAEQAEAGEPGKDEPARADLAGQHRGVLQEIAGLLDELVLIAGDSAMPKAEIVGWLEFGLARLSLGYPPPALDSVLLTDIQRGRHHPVMATLLIGMAEDAWPPAARESPYLSDEERRLLNTDGAQLVSRGAADAAAREPYLALVAATRASRHLCIMRPAAGKDGRQRAPSPYFEGIRAALGLTEQVAARGAVAYPTRIVSARDALLAAALHPEDQALQELAQESGQQAMQMARALCWAREYRRAAGKLAPLPEPDMLALLNATQEATILRGSASRLETFAECPFKHFARYFLNLREREAPAFDSLALGGFYHRVLEQTVQRLNEAGFDWLSGEAAEMRRVSNEVLAELGDELKAETGQERTAYVLERARLLLDHYAARLLAQLREQKRSPAFTEVRFGSSGDAQLPPVKVDTSFGRLLLSGYIDRLDLEPDGGATVVDYKLGGMKMSWARFLAGGQVQLPAYLLAVHNQQIEGGKELSARSAEYQQIEPSWKGRSADFSPTRILPLPAKKDERPAAELLERVLAETERVLAELAGRIFSGEITPWPLRDARGSPWRACTHCEYRAFCRFDPAAGERYRDVINERDSTLREKVLAGDASLRGSAGALEPGLDKAGGGE
ncbi:PD-(D/E)XK nuclease family protein [bacterium]|nr:PD-(D/E)XK nuclease family protein [bacterium]